MSSDPKSVAAAAPPSTAIATRSASLLMRIAERYGVEADKMNTTLKDTAFKQRGKKDAGGARAAAPEISNEQMIALLIVADKYDLNPFMREIYAYPLDGGGVAPFIGVDGWITMVNRQPNLEYFEFEYAPTGTDAKDAFVRCTMKRTDRARAVTVEENYAECYRATDPWDKMPRRMLRHKAFMQAARLCFGFVGIEDDDDAEARFNAARDVTPRDQRKPPTPDPKTVAEQTGATRKGKPPTREPERTAESAKGSAPKPAADAGGPRISMDQATVLADRIKEEGLQLSEVLGTLEIGALEDLPASAFDRAQSVINYLSE